MQHKEGWPKSYLYTFIRCTYGIFSREITIRTAIYGVHTVFQAKKSPYVRPYTVCMTVPAKPKHKDRNSRRKMFTLVQSSVQRIHTESAAHPRASWHGSIEQTGFASTRGAVHEAQCTRRSARSAALISAKQ